MAIKGRKVFLGKTANRIKMTLAMQLVDVLRDYNKIMSMIPEKAGSLQMPEDAGKRLAVSIGFQKAFETTSRMSEVLELSVILEGKKPQEILLQRLRVYTRQLIAGLSELSQQNLETLAFFLLPSFEPNRKYITGLVSSRPSEVLQGLNEAKNFLSVLLKVNDAIRVALFRGELTLGTYPEADISKAVLQKIEL